MRTCPKCGIVLTGSEAAGDSCPSCGKRRKPILSPSSPRYLGIISLIAGASLLLLFLGIPMYMAYARAKSVTFWPLAVVAGVIFLLSGAVMVIFGGRFRWLEQIKGSRRSDLVIGAIITVVALLFLFGVIEVLHSLGYTFADPNAASR